MISWCCSLKPFLRAYDPDLTDNRKLNGSKYYRGGFEQNMSRREAALILGVSQQSSRNKIRDAHKRIMLLNHPDKGGSPYLAAKINQAKDILESNKS
ncbi:unnamed protein product [Schistosoma haematobium]|nr:unnamed protein product [Schistosoma haematobium]CAH8432230.1 unnamed protein product [Schistosoma haematobium]